MSNVKSGITIVTGAARGIGAATLRHLVGQQTRVIALDRSEENLATLCEEIGSDDIIPCTYDLSDLAGIPDLISKLLAYHGPITALVNNAGIWPEGPIVQMSDEDWRQTFAVNVDAPFALIRGLAPAMADAGGGAIVTVSSRNAFRSSTNVAAYDASKAAALALTRTAAGELAKHNIRVNAVCPGVISTLGASDAEQPLFKSAYTKQIPMQRYGRPEEIASVIAFLLSEEASYITGQSLIVDGGQIACQDNDRFMEIPGLKP